MKFQRALALSWLVSNEFVLKEATLVPKQFKKTFNLGWHNQVNSLGQHKFVRNNATHSRSLALASQNTNLTKVDLRS